MLIYFEELKKYNFWFVGIYIVDKYFCKNGIERRVE